MGKGSSGVSKMASKEMKQALKVTKNIDAYTYTDNDGNKHIIHFIADGEDTLTRIDSHSPSEWQILSDTPKTTAISSFKKNNSNVKKVSKKKVAEAEVEYRKDRENFQKQAQSFYYESKTARKADRKAAIMRRQFNKKRV